MTTRVVGTPPQIVASSDGTRDRYRAALPVEGPGQWYQLATAANWIAGCGGALACHGFQYTSIAAGSSSTRRFWLWPRSLHESWLWSVELRAEYDIDAVDGYEGANGTITVTPGGDAYDFTLPSDTPKRFWFVQDPSSISEGEATITVAVDADSPSSVYINTVVISMLRRGFLSIASGSTGTYVSSCDKGQPIYEDTDFTDKFSAQSVWETVLDAKTGSRRQSIFHWSDPAGVTVTTTAFPGTSNIFAIDPAIQTRNMADGGGTTRNVKWNVYAKMNAAGSAEVRVTMTTGATSTITVTSTTATWHTAASFAIETDDLSASDTIRGASRDVARFEARRVSGTSVEVYAISVGEST